MFGIDDCSSSKVTSFIGLIVFHAANDKMETRMTVDKMVIEVFFNV